MWITKPLKSKFTILKIQKFHFPNLVSLRYAKSVGALHFNTSAKLNNGIDEMFLHLSQQMMSKHDEKVKNTPGLVGNGIRGSSHGGGISIVDDSELLPPRKSGCCGGSTNIQEGMPDPASQ